MPPLVKSEPEEGLGMSGMYNRRTQAMDLGQDFPAVSAPLYDFHFSSGQSGLGDLQSSPAFFSLLHRALGLPLAVFKYDLHESPAF